jgi:hypothetical protein
MEHQIDEKIEQFFDSIDWQIIKLMKEVERKLDSVRKEREGAISIIEELVKKSYNQFNQYY